MRKFERRKFLTTRKKSTLMNTAAVSLVRSEHGLDLYHYTDEATHPSDASFYKGVVMDGDRIVARSFQWAPTVIASSVEEGSVYTPFREGTVLRFYRHEGKPMVSTHRQVDISDKKSRVGTGRPFMELIPQAMASWPGKNETRIVDGKKRVLTTPTSWEDLCIEGWCHVFLLVDTSNQITDLTDLTETYEMPTETGEMTVRTFATPLLLHAMSLDMRNGVGVPQIGMPEYAFSDEEGTTYYTWAVPSLPILSAASASLALAEGKAVVGFKPETPDVTVKFFSPEYERKLMIAGETFNPVHRWHILMDQDPELAEEYIQMLPWHHKEISYKTMQDTHLRYLEESANFLADIAIRRFNSESAHLDQNLYRQVQPLIGATIAHLQDLYRKKQLRSEQGTSNEATRFMMEQLMELPYATQHTIHGKIAKIKAGF